MYTYPYMNWSETTQEQRDTWFNAFRGSFTWSEDLEGVVRAEFEVHAARRLSSIISRVGVHDAKPKWMNVNVFEHLQKRRQEPDFVERSKRAQQNKKKDADDGVIRPSHHMGSISAIEYAQRVTKEQGKLPTTPDLFYRTHNIASDDGSRSFKSKKAQAMHEKFSSKMSELQTQGTNIPEDQLYFDVVGGRKKGKVYGLDSAAGLYYQGVSGSRSSSSTATSHSPGLIRQLEERAEQAEKARQEDRQYMEQQLVAQREQLTQQMREEMRLEIERL